MTLFLVIGTVGLAVLGVSLLLGDLAPGVGDAIPGDLLSTEVIGAFVAATGFGGAIADRSGTPAPACWLVGVAAGVVFAWLTGRLTRLVRGGGSDATPATSETVGHSGHVVSAIPEGGFGNVSIVVGGRTVRLHARADTPLEIGTEVHVTGVVSPTAVTVSPTGTQLP